MTTLNPALAQVLGHLHYPLQLIQSCVRWYMAYPLSLRDLAEVMAEGDISVDYLRVHRCGIKVLPVLEKAQDSPDKVSEQGENINTIVALRFQTAQRKFLKPSMDRVRRLIAR